MIIDNKMTKDSRISTLDSFRGIAAICVLLYHYTTIFREKYGHSYSQAYDFFYGFYGVQLFFIISGFVIYLTINRCKSPWEFAYRRFIRLFPTYWVCLIFTTLFLLFFGPPLTKPTLSLFLKNVTMVQYLFQADYIDGSYWSLFPELIFYTLIFATFYIGIVKKIYIWGNLWLVASVIIALYPFARHHNLLPYLFQYAGLFYSGVLFYKIYHGSSTYVNHLSVVACFLVVLVNNSSLQKILTPDVFKHIILPLVVIYALFYLFIFNKLKFLNVKILAFLGKISYPLYLIHQAFGYVILLALKKHGYDNLFCLIIPLILSVCIAYLVSRYFENPVQLYFKKKLSR